MLSLLLHIKFYWSLLLLNYLWCTSFTGPDSNALLQGQAITHWNPIQLLQGAVGSNQEGNRIERGGNADEKIERELRKKNLELEITVLKENNELERNQKLEKQNLEMEKLKKNNVNTILPNSLFTFKSVDSFSAHVQFL